MVCKVHKCIKEPAVLNPKVGPKHHSWHLRRRNPTKLSIPFTNILHIFCLFALSWYSIQNLWYFKCSAMWESVSQDIAYPISKKCSSYEQQFLIDEGLKRTYFFKFETHKQNLSSRPDPMAMTGALCAWRLQWIPGSMSVSDRYPKLDTIQISMIQHKICFSLKSQYVSPSPPTASEASWAKTSGGIAVDSLGYFSISALRVSMSDAMSLAVIALLFTAFGSAPRCPQNKWMSFSLLSCPEI